MTVTEHCLENGNRIVIAVNNQNELVNTVLGKAEIKDVYYGNAYNRENNLYVSLAANDMVVFEIKEI